MRTSGHITQQDVEKIVAASTKVLSDKVKELEAKLAQVTEERDTWNEYAFEATLSEHRNRETIRRLVVSARAMWAETRSEIVYSDVLQRMIGNMRDEIRRALEGEEKRNDTN